MVSQSISRMARASVEGVELECEVRGSGEPVLLIHGALVGDAFAPLLSQPSLAESYQLVHYHRRGFAGSAHSIAPVSIIEQAVDARALLDLLGIKRAHIIGHSFGGVIALQLALDASDRVHSLSLLEPALEMVPSAATFMEQVQPVFQHYEAGDKARAIDGFGRAVAGPGFRNAVDRVLPPGWFEQAVVDADTFFRIEMPALFDWSFTPELAARITQPVLSVLGAESAAVTPMTVEVHELLQDWMPQTESYILPEATHALQLMNPVGMATGLARFFASHPMSASAIRSGSTLRPG